MNITVIRIETRVCHPEFATYEAAQKWVAKQKDSKNPEVEYQIWVGGSPVAR